MKRLTFLLLFIACSTFTISCSSDDSDDPIVIDESLIPGDWSLTGIVTEDGEFTTTYNGFPISGSFDGTGKDYTAEISFVEGAEGESNTFTSSGGFTAVASIEIPTQDPFEVEQAFPEFFGAGTWSVNGNTLSTTVQGESQSYEIRELSETSMKLAVALDESVNYNLDGDDITVDLTGTIIITLTKN